MHVAKLSGGSSDGSFVAIVTYLWYVMGLILPNPGTFEMVEFRRGAAGCLAMSDERYCEVFEDDVVVGKSRIGAIQGWREVGNDVVYFHGSLSQSVRVGIDCQELAGIAWGNACRAQCEGSFC
jgi:hypothetical protein